MARRLQPLALIWAKSSGSLSRAGSDQLFGGSRANSPVRANPVGAGNPQPPRLLVERVHQQGSDPSIPSAPPDPPLVSVGLPVFNAERFLEACLDSLVAQSYPHFEIIVSDNASTDQTLQILQKYAARDERVRVFPSDVNRGAVWNHERVRALGRGSYFKWCGADDIVAPRFLEECTAALEVRPDAVLAFPLSVVIDDEGRTLRRTTDRLPLASADVATRFGALLSAWDHTHNPFYGVVRRPCLEQVRPMGSFLAGDRSLLAELALLGPFLQVEEFLMYRRNHAEHRRRTPQREQEGLSPQRKEQFCAREWTMLREHFRSILRAPLAIRSKLRLLRVLGQWALANHGELSGELRAYLNVTVHRITLRSSRMCW
jgi:Glycosyl transferase family 2